jgi:hypothetical protein
MQPVNSGGHHSAHLQEMKQHAEGHKKFTAREGPYLPAPNINHNTDIPPTPNLVLFVATARLQPGMIYHKRAKMKCWTSQNWSEFKMWKEKCILQTSNCVNYIQHYCAWPTNLGIFASFCFVQLSENHKTCGRISEVGVRSRYLLSLQISLKSLFAAMTAVCYTWDVSRITYAQCFVWI